MEEMVQESVQEPESRTDSRELLAEIAVLRNQIQQAERLLGYALDLMMWEDSSLQNAWEDEVVEFLKKKKQLPEYVELEGTLADGIE